MQAKAKMWNYWGERERWEKDRDVVIWGTPQNPKMCKEERIRCFHEGRENLNVDKEIKQNKVLSSCMELDL